MKKRFYTRSAKPEAEWDIWRTEVIEVLDDGKENVIGSDGGEPEDQTLDRDWAWVVDALNKAYEDGYKNGQEDTLNSRVNEVIEKVKIKIENKKIGFTACFKSGPISTNPSKEGNCRMPKNHEGDCIYW